MKQQMNLIAVEGWVNTQKAYRGRLRNEEGYGLSGYFCKDYKNHCSMHLIDNGHVKERIKYPKVEYPFHSSLLRWRNANFNENPYFDEAIFIDHEDHADSNSLLLEAVIAGHKPLGSLFVDVNEVDSFVKSAKENDISHIVLPYGCENHFCITLAKQGKIKEHFNMEELFLSYRLFSQAVGYEILTKEDEEWLREVSETEFPDFLKMDFETTSHNAKPVNHVLIGLLLGYPIELTVASIVMRRNANKFINAELKEAIVTECQVTSRFLNGFDVEFKLQGEKRTFNGRFHEQTRKDGDGYSMSIRYFYNELWLYTKEPEGPEVDLIAEQILKQLGSEAHNEVYDWKPKLV